MKKFLELAKARHSVRAFNSQKIEQSKLNQILEAGRVAPTACNIQPQRIKVITSQEELAMIDDCTGCRFGAPVVLLVCYDQKVCWSRKYDGAKSGEVDASIVTTHMMLAARDLGLGSCWVMHFDPVKLIASFNIPDNLVPVAMLPIGYPEEYWEPARAHDERKPIEEILF